MPQHTPKLWSEGLREATREALRDVPVTPDGRIHMKQIDGGFGSIDLLELVAGNYVLHRKGSDESVCFADEDAVVAAGWAID